MDIKPCPFCGGEHVADKTIWGKHFVSCDGCGADGPEANNESDGIMRWNALANKIFELEREVTRLANYVDDITLT